LLNQLSTSSAGAPRTPSGGRTPRWKNATLVLLAAALIVVLLVWTGIRPAAGGPDAANLPPADTPPLEYAYLDSFRAAAYLGQMEDGLATSEQRTEQLTRSVDASISAGTTAQLGASEQAQQGTHAIVTPTAADRFYNFMRLLREGGEASCQVVGHEANGDICNPDHCNGTSRTRWLGEVDAEWSARKIMDEVGCVGVGNFIRVAHAQLFLPPFAQVLTRAQSASAVYGKLPAPRTAFTGPTRSSTAPAERSSYVGSLAQNARLPFVAASYGSTEPVGSGVTFFLPARYAGLTTEPALLSGSVTVVGKIIYSASAGQPYVDYPTIGEFGPALVRRNPSFLDSLGVCAKHPPPQTRSLTGHAQNPTESCKTHPRTLEAVKRSVTYAPPVVVVLPLAIYQ
jgi:hypothetical protein